VTAPLFNRTETGVIRFTRRIARQCSPAGSSVPERIVCDTIANGSRQRVGKRGTRGGALILFERTYPGGPDGTPSTVRVLGELTRSGCFALQLLSAARIRKKNWDNSGLLIRPCTK
jgi:hypothetical protein